MTLEQIADGMSLSGIEPDLIVTVVTTIPHGDGAIQLLYRRPDGTIHDRLLLRADEGTVAQATAGRPARSTSRPRSTLRPRR